MASLRSDASQHLTSRARQNCLKQCAKRGAKSGGDAESPHSRTNGPAVALNVHLRKSNVQSRYHIARLVGPNPRMLVTPLSEGIHRRWQERKRRSDECPSSKTFSKLLEAIPSKYVPLTAKRKSSVCALHSPMVGTLPFSRGPQTLLDAKVSTARPAEQLICI